MSLNHAHDTPLSSKTCIYLVFFQDAQVFFTLLLTRNPSFDTATSTITTVAATERTAASMEIETTTLEIDYQAV